MTGSHHKTEQKKATLLISLPDAPPHTPTHKSKKKSSKDPPKDTPELEKTIQRITAHTGVQGIVVATHEGTVVRSTLDNIQTQQISTLVTQLAARGKGVVRDIDPEDDLVVLRIRSRKHEVR